MREIKVEEEEEEHQSVLDVHMQPLISITQCEDSNNKSNNSLKFPIFKHPIQPPEHFIDDQSKSACNICGKFIAVVNKINCYDYSATRSHAHSHLFEMWQCPICDYKTNTKRNVKRHLNATHKISNEVVVPKLMMTSEDYHLLVLYKARECFPGLYSNYL